MRNTVTSPQRAHTFRAGGQWTHDTLSSQVRDHSRARGDRVAVVDRNGQRRRTYAELDRDAAAVAAALQRLGVGAGDVISVQLPNCYEGAVTAVAVQSVSAVLNPLLPNYRVRELSHVFRTATPKAIFVPAQHRGFSFPTMLDAVEAETGISPARFILGDHGQFGADNHVSLDAVLDWPNEQTGPLSRQDASAVSELIFTSGTEATPKAIMHSEETANFAVRTLFEDLEINDNHVAWMPSPIGHSTGFNYGIRAALVHGRKLVLQDQWDASDAIENIQRDDCSYTLAATTFLRDLVEECERTSTTLTGLTRFGCGGAPVPPELVDRANAVGIEVLRLYGSTEVLCATWNRPDSPKTKKRTTDGYPLSHTEVQLRDSAGRIVVGPGEGELFTRGPHTSVGLFDDAERQAAIYEPDGWVRSGDLVTIDEDGYLSVIGRSKEIIIRGGINIAPREIEDLIAAFPEVVSVAVVGVPDPRLGERSFACVVLRSGTSLSLDDMSHRLKLAGLATYKLPEGVTTVDEFPMTPSGKIQKFELVRRLVSLQASATEVR